MLSIITELSTLLYNDLPNLLPYFGVCALVHIVVQYILPLFYPNIYDSLDNKNYTTFQATLQKRPSLATEARTCVISILFSVHVTSLSLWYLMYGPEVDMLEKNVDGTTDYTMHLIRCAVTYFLWDILVCYLDKYGIEWYIHAICCIGVYTAALVSIRKKKKIDLCIYICIKVRLLINLQFILLD